MCASIAHLVEQNMSEVYLTGKYSLLLQGNLVHETGLTFSLTQNIFSNIS